MRHGIAVATCGLLLLTAGCESPVEDELIASLGPEVAGLGEGPLHRYGQPCLACHGGYGPGPLFSVAGTLFATPDEDIPVEGGTILITDANGEQRSLTTNCAGNFYVSADLWAPAFPLRAEVDCATPGGEAHRALMGTRINRDGGCASCHQQGPADAASAGQLFCLPDQPDPPFVRATACAGGPQ